MGIVACLQTHGSRVNWHPHLHLLVTDGGFRPHGMFVSWPVHDAARLTDAFRRAELRLFVRLDLFDDDCRLVAPSERARELHYLRPVKRSGGVSLGSRAWGVARQTIAKGC